MFLTLTVLSVLTLIGALFAEFWIQQISDFKALNHAKFTVLNDMAPNFVPPPLVGARFHRCFGRAVGGFLGIC